MYRIVQYLVHNGIIVFILYYKFNFQVTLYNSASQTAQILQLRGSTIPNDITSTADAMTIAFHSDYSVTYAGFRLEYSVDGKI